jgi:MFS transporter, Spinster family, sphingosine-1-phosphate transporter
LSVPEPSRSLNYRRYLLALLTVVYAFNFLDRNVLAMVMQAIKLDLDLSDTQLGFMSGIAFALFYATLGIPIARWADRGNRIAIISFTTALWSAMVIFCGMANSFVQMLIARVGVAIGEAGCVPPAQSLIGDYYSRQERPRAMSIYMIGMPLSVVLGFAVAGWINEWYGWRVTFFAVGLPGILLTLVVMLSLHEPRNRGKTTIAAPSVGKTQESTWLVFSTLWRQPSYRHLLLGYTVVNLFSYGIAQWTPAFLIRTHHIETGELGSWYALIWGVGGAAGTYLGGYWASRHAVSNERLQLRVMAAVLLGFVPLYLGIYLTSSLYTAFALMMLSALIYCSMNGPLFAMLQELVAPRMRATSVAIVLFFSNLIGLGLGPMAVGVMSDVLAPLYGEDSLKVSLLMWTPGYLWAAYHLLRAGKSVQADIATVHSATAVT